MSPAPSFPSRARTLPTAVAAAIGGSLAWWHWRSPWFAALAVLTVVLLVLAVGWPRGYAPVYRVLDRGVQTFLQGVTWLLLGVVFLLVFVPGRLWLALRRHDPLARRSGASTWREFRPRKDPASHFRAQF